MRKVQNTLTPRLPKEAREKLKKSATHKDKKAWKRHVKHKKSFGISENFDSPLYQVHEMVREFVEKVLSHSW